MGGTSQKIFFARSCVPSPGRDHGSPRTTIGKSSRTRETRPFGGGRTRGPGTSSERPFANGPSDAEIDGIEIGVRGPQALSRPASPSHGRPPPPPDVRPSDRPCDLIGFLPAPRTPLVVMLQSPLRSKDPVVTLVNAFPRPFENAVATARTCYSPRGIVDDRRRLGGAGPVGGQAAREGGAARPDREVDLPGGAPHDAPARPLPVRARRGVAPVPVVLPPRPPLLQQRAGEPALRGGEGRRLHGARARRRGARGLRGLRRAADGRVPRADRPPDAGRVEGRTSTSSPPGR